MNGNQETQLKNMTAHQFRQNALVCGTKCIIAILLKTHKRTHWSRLLAKISELKTTVVLFSKLFEINTGLPSNT